MKLKHLWLALGVLGIGLFLNSCIHHPSPRYGPDEPPAAPREFRAAWVATVANIDWPSKPGLSVEQQQKEILEICEKSAELRLNALILQVRTSCDAFYPSELEPWSEYLTGKQGQAPEPFYDPLRMWIEECHKRGSELHAWLNPYRARHPSAKTPDAPSHVSHRFPQAVRSFNGYEWLDPADKAGQEHTLQVFADIVHRYDIDGIHMDDYFYPYPDYLKQTTPQGVKYADFPDEPTWQEYLKTGGKLARDDWRRAQVNFLVEQIYKRTKSEKKSVKFGISPFGIWRPGNPAIVKGFDQYDKLYADAKLWLNQGWCDYYTPQLYWKISAPNQPYPVLLDWWIGENHKHRHIWPGNSISAVGNSWDKQETLDQINLTRQRTGSTGNVFFSFKTLMKNSGGLSDALRDGPYS